MTDCWFTSFPLCGNYESTCLYMDKLCTLHLVIVVLPYLSTYSTMYLILQVVNSWWVNFQDLTFGRDGFRTRLPCTDLSFLTNVRQNFLINYFSTTGWWICVPVQDSSIFLLFFWDFVMLHVSNCIAFPLFFPRHTHSCQTVCKSFIPNEM